MISLIRIANTITYWNHHRTRKVEEFRDAKGKVGVDIEPFRIPEGKPRANVKFILYIYFLPFSVTFHLKT